mmetsp:Transcript_102595/g.293855  ORF Transcript_102595/g.293855 Transcript_102595/m.293855 type:complete len:214 (-) Transcript_102595:373-1014(-)
MDAHVLSVTHTEPLAFKRSAYAGHACAVRTAADVRSVLQYMHSTAPWMSSAVSPCAWRLEAEEGHDDHGDLGAGEKLLGLLQRWDVRNVIIVVTRHDSKSLHGGSFLAPEKLGIQRYRIVLGRAKHVLEQCYLASVNAGGGGGTRARGDSSVVAVAGPVVPAGTSGAKQNAGRGTAASSKGGAATVVQFRPSIPAYAGVPKKAGRPNHWQEGR